MRNTGCWWDGGLEMDGWMGREWEWERRLRGFGSEEIRGWI